MDSFESALRSEAISTLAVVLTGKLSYRASRYMDAGSGAPCVS